MLIDTHAHVHDKQFADDRAEVMQRARSAGVAEVITVGCDIADTGRALAAAREFGIYASVGVQRTLTMHWDGGSWTIIASPSVGPGTNYLSGVAAVSMMTFWGGALT